MKYLRDAWYKWRVLSLFWLVYFLNHADRQILFSVFPMVQRELGLSDGQLGLLASSFQWVYGLLVPLAGVLGDVANRKRLIAVALTAWSALTFSSGLAGSFGALAVLRGLTGVGEAFYYPAATSMIGDYHGERTRAFAMSIHQTSLYAGIVCSGALAGYMAQTWGWRQAFFTFGAAGIAVAVVILKVLREPCRGAAERQGKRPQDGPRMALRARLAEFYRRPTPALLACAFMGMNFGALAAATWMPTLLHRKFGYSLAKAGFHATFHHQAGAFLGVLAGGRLADRWAGRWPVVRPLVQAAGLLLAAPFLYVMGKSGSSPAVLVSMGLFGVFRGVYDSNLFASLYEVVAPEARATATGIMIALAFLVGGSAPALIGGLSERVGLGPAMASSSAAFLAAGVIIVLNSVLCFSRDACAMRGAREREAAPGVRP